MQRAMVYSRVSTPNDPRDASLSTQEAATIAHMRSLGYVVDDADVYRERASGKTMEGRPVLTSILEKCKRGGYKALGFYCLDRFARSQIQTAILMDRLERYGVVPISATNDCGDSTPEGKLILAIRSYLAEAERLKIEERIQRGRQRYREQGIFIGSGRTPYGYTFLSDSHRRIIDPIAAAVVKLIYERAVAGESHAATARLLNGQGVPSAVLHTGKRAGRQGRGLWVPATIGSMIANPAYKGWTVSNRFFQTADPEDPRPNPKCRKRPREEWDILDKTGVITTAIVTEATWEAANDATRNRACNRGARSATVPRQQRHLLRKMIWCGTCGERLYANHSVKTNRLVDGSTKDYSSHKYVCRARTHMHKGLVDPVRCTQKAIQQKRIDGAVWSAFCQVVLTPGRVEAAIAAIEAEGDATTELSEQRESTASALKKQEQARDRIFAKWRAEQDSGDDPDFAGKLEAEYKQMRPMIEGLRDALREAENRLAAATQGPKLAASFAGRFDQLRARLAIQDDTTWEERYQALTLARVRVVATHEAFALYLDLFSENDVKPTTIGTNCCRFDRMPILAEEALFVPNSLAAAG